MLVGLTRELAGICLFISVPLRASPNKNVLLIKPIGDIYIYIPRIVLLTLSLFLELKNIQTPHTLSYPEFRFFIQK
jgi:hypothetical protein